MQASKFTVYDVAGASLTTFCNLARKHNGIQQNIPRQPATPGTVRIEIGFQPADADAFEAELAASGLVATKIS